MSEYYIEFTRVLPSGIPITQVVIFLQETSDEIAFTQEYIDEITTHRYRVVRLWEENSALFLNNQALLPLAPLTQTDSPATLLSQVGNKIARISDIDVR